MRGVELRDVRPESCVQRHEGEPDLPRVVSVLEREERQVAPLHFGRVCRFGDQVNDHLVPSHLETHFMGDLGMVPEAVHLAEVTLEEELYLDLQGLFHFLASPLLRQAHLPIAPLDHLQVCGPRIWRLKHLCRDVLSDVDEHVCVVDAHPGRSLRSTQLPRAALKVVPHRKVRATIIIFHGCVLAAWCHGVVVKLEPSMLEVWPDVGVVVPAVHVAAVDHDRVKNVGAGIGSELAEVQAPMELKLGVELHHVHLLEVEVETFQLQVQHRRERQETDALLGPLLAVSLCLVGVVPLEGLLRCEVLEGLIDGHVVLAALALYVQLDVVECFIPLGLVVHIDTFDVILHLALKEPLDGTIHRCAFHLLLQSVAQNPVQLLCVVLCEGVHGVPTKRLHELSAVHCLV
mmetsp:Transcript_64893/g.146355  ORF Transcript_64893/g.146355 Transcript_64893/m.146355 type:complete len:403 (-) Transcript_64893:736-1944(-)